MPNEDTKKTESAPKSKAPSVHPGKVKLVGGQKPPVGFLVIGIVLLFGSLILWRFVPTNPRVIFHKDKDPITFNVAVAKDDKTRNKGLSGVTKLSDRTGMLFVYQEDEVPKFWMKDMKFAIDIIWIDSERRVIGVKHDVSPSDFPITYSPTKPIRYVLEIKAGLADRYNLRENDYVELQLR